MNVSPIAGYNAPVETYREFYFEDIQNIMKPIYSDINVCVGKEWYRYPSSFFLPGARWRLRFLKSGFKGQLPKPYSEGPSGSRVIPTDMNDMNREEPSRYVSGLLKDSGNSSITQTHTHI